jgi:hypothetical protein
MEAGIRKLPFGEGSKSRKTAKRNTILNDIPENDSSKPLKRALLTDFFTPRKAILPEVAPENPLEDTRIRCEFEEIPEKFLRLIQCCARAANVPISEADVLTALLQTDGKVADTINAFVRRD